MNRRKDWHWNHVPVQTGVFGYHCYTPSARKAWYYKPEEVDKLVVYFAPHVPFTPHTCRTAWQMRRKLFEFHTGIRDRAQMFQLMEQLEAVMLTGDLQAVMAFGETFQMEAKL